MQVREKDSRKQVSSHMQCCTSPPTRPPRCGSPCEGGRQHDQHRIVSSGSKRDTISHSVITAHGRAALPPPLFPGYMCCRNQLVLRPPGGGSSCTATLSRVMRGSSTGSSKLNLEPLRWKRPQHISTHDRPQTPVRPQAPCNQHAIPPGECRPHSSSGPFGLMATRGLFTAAPEGSSPRRP